MRKVLLLLVTWLVSLGAMAADNLLAGGINLPVMLQRSTHEYTDTERGYLVDGVKNATESNTVNLDLFYDGKNDGFYFDLGATTKLGVVRIYWTGKHCTNYKIYASSEVPTLENPGTEIGSFNEYGALNDDTRYKSYAGGVGSEYRYVAYVPDETANFYGSMMSEFEIFSYEEATLTSLSLNTGIAVFNSAGNGFNASPADQNGITMESGVTYEADNGATVHASGNAFTLVAPKAGIYTITATAGDKTATAKVALIDDSDLPAAPTATSGNVLSVFCDTYSDAEPGISDPAWNWKYTTRLKPEIATGNYIYIVDKVGTFGLNPGATDITGYNKLNLDIYVVEPTTGKVAVEGGTGIDKTFDLKAGWNRLGLDIEGNTGTAATWIQVYIGESAADNNRSIALDNVYYSKDAIDDTESPVLSDPVVKSVNVASVTLTLKATDDKSQKITYAVTDKATGTVYTAKGDNDTDFDFVVSPLQSGTDYTFSVVAKDANDNASAAKEVSATTTALTAAPTPDKDAANVKSLYSDLYTAAVAYHYGSWGQSTAVATETVGSDEMLKLTTYNYLGFEFEGATIDLKDMEYVHIDVLPLQDMTLGITPIMNGGTPTENSTSVGTLKVGEWNSCDVKLADLGLDYENAQAFQLKIDGGTGTDIVYVDNIYFWKGGEAPVVNPVPVPNEPTAAAANVLAVYSQTYGKAELTTSNPTWGGYKDATSNDLYTSSEYTELTTDGGEKHKVVHVTGTGINSRTAGDKSAAGYDKLYAAIYPTTATKGIIFKDNGYADAVTIEGLVPNQWNYVEKDVNFDNNYVTIALDGETEFYVDHVYFTKPDVTAVTLTAAAETIAVGTTTQLSVKDQREVAVDAADVTFASSAEAVATVSEAGVVTAVAEGTATITATLKTNTDVQATVTITVIQPIALPSVPEEPTLDAADVDAIYSAKYDKGIKEQNPAWGGGPNPLWTSVEEVELAAGKKSIHVNGTGYGDRPAEALTTDFNKAFVALYPATATKGKLYADDGYADAIEFDLKPLEWNYVEVGAAYNTNYVMVELEGETEFYLDHFYFAKVADTEAPVIADATVEAGYTSAVVTATATDDSNATISYTFTLGETVQEAQAASGAAAEVTFDGLELGKEYTVTIVAKDAAENASEAKTVTFTTKTLPAIAAAPAPTADADYVQGIYTDAYNTPAGVAFRNFHGVDVVADEIAASDNADDKLYRIYTNKGFNFYGMQLDKAYDLSTFKTIHVDIWSSGDATIGFSPINQATEPHTNKQVLTLHEGWNQFDLPAADFATGETAMDITTVDQLEFFDAPADIVVAIDNIYFVSDTVITGISDATRLTNGGMANTQVYDLQGRRVAQPARGLYIVNGRKVVMK